MHCTIMDSTVPKYSFNHCDRKPCFWPWNLYSTRRERWRFKRKQLNKQKRRHQGVVYIFLLRWRNLNRWSIKRGKHMTRYCILAHIAFSNFTEEKKKTPNPFPDFGSMLGKFMGRNRFLPLKHGSSSPVFSNYQMKEINLSQL